MRTLFSIALATLIAGFALPADAAKKKAKRRYGDASTVGLGRACSSGTPCRHKAQTCLKRQDANGKELDQGICVLPCKPFDAGVKRTDPPPPMTPEGVVKAKPMPRCPKKYECRTKGRDVPIDICVRD